MINKSNRSPHRAARTIVTATHKFPVGTYVLHKTGVLCRKEAFRITRLLPDDGGGFQYRIKSEREGFERVAMEASLEAIG